MDLVAAAGLTGLLFVKEAGVPIPIPGDLLVIGAGVATAGDPVGAIALLGVILVAGYAGGSIQFLIARGALRQPLINLLTRVGVPQARIESLAERLRRGGARPWRSRVPRPAFGCLPLPRVGWPRYPCRRSPPGS
ncbi:MAG: hypothetical protein WD830_03920 [Chloroflexota bacterium]